MFEKKRRENWNKHGHFVVDLLIPFHSTYYSLKHRIISSLYVLVNALGCSEEVIHIGHHLFAEAIQKNFETDLEKL